jgi:hypothetical protein
MRIAAVHRIKQRAAQLDAYRDRVVRLVIGELVLCQEAARDVPAENVGNAFRHEVNTASPQGLST